ncbi:MAG: NAD-dependent epimerase/dehydratase family protein [Chloroflexota bacterium]|nr:NAD-dependent epimerase/dehydratase family protein [Chloroflexota bacterium]
MRKLRARGDDVTAAVRNPARARALRDLGCRLVGTDLSSTGELTGLMAGSGAVIHAAGSYRVGVADRERPAMDDANVGGTTRVLAAAGAAGIARILYLSTVSVFGNTHGEVVDETFRRDPNKVFLTWYDETKYRAHLVAEAHLASGAPVVIAMPGQVYGQGDPSAVGQQLAGAFRGRLAYLALTDVGFCLVHVDDLADGLLAALDRGRLGQSYVLDGEPVRLIDGLRIAARLGGRRLPRLSLPTRLLRRMAFLSGPLGGRLGVPANLAEVISGADGVTYWASHAKASRELGFAPRLLEAGLRDTFGAG